jgi:hypothetical protein
MSTKISKSTIFGGFLTLAVVIGCSDNSPTQEQEESISRPYTPTGNAALNPDSTGTFVTGGAHSNLGHELEYRFNWGDGRMSAWSQKTEVTNSWSTEGTFEVSSQARCREHTWVTSVNSGSMEVLVGFESVSDPVAPAGPDSVCAGKSVTFVSGGATSSFGNAVEYQFDWNDGSFSQWSAAEAASHVWSNEGAYSCKARARSAVDTAVVSAWSASTAVTAIPAQWIVEYAVPELTGEYLPSQSLLSSYVVYGGPPGLLDAVGVIYEGYGGGTEVILCYGDDDLPPAYLMFTLYIGIGSEPYFRDVDLCAHGSVHTTWVCDLGPVDLYSHSRSVANGDSLRFGMSNWVFWPADESEICGYKSDPPYGRLDDVRVRIRCQCTLDQPEAQDYVKSPH